VGAPRARGSQVRGYSFHVFEVRGHLGEHPGALRLSLRTGCVGWGVSFCGDNLEPSRAHLLVEVFRVEALKRHASPWEGRKGIAPTNHDGRHR
jgi:hypothetical protein